MHRSLAPAVKNADEGEDRAAPFPILMFTCAGAAGTIEAHVSPFSCSWHRERQLSHSLLELWDLLNSNEGKGLRAEKTPQICQSSPACTGSTSGAVAPFAATPCACRGKG